MAKYCGLLYIIEVETTAGSGTFTKLGNLRDTSLSSSNEQVDVTDKDSNKKRELLNCGVHSKSLSGSGVFTDNAMLLIVQARSDDGALWNYRVTSEYGDQYEGAFQTSGFERNGGYNGAEEYSVSLESSGDIAYTAAP